MRTRQAVAAAALGDASQERSGDGSEDTQVRESERGEPEDSDGSGDSGNPEDPGY
ncbi:MAG: hypothetical protein ACREMG_02790 [Gemmatimonadales bacterium]